MKWNEYWVETFAIGLTILAFVIAILLTNSAAIYITAIFAGFIAARVFYFRRFKEPIFPFIIIIIGFLIGYVVGSFSANRFITLTIFVLAYTGSYYLHKKKIIVIFKSENFLK